MQNIIHEDIIHEDIIHEDRVAAEMACEEYIKAANDLCSKFGTWEENDDSCSGTHICTQYRDESGKVTRYCY